MYVGYTLTMPVNATNDIGLLLRLYLMKGTIYVSIVDR